MKERITINPFNQNRIDLLLGDSGEVVRYEEKTLNFQLIIEWDKTKEMYCLTITSYPNGNSTSAWMFDSVQDGLDFLCEREKLPELNVYALVENSVYQGMNTLTGNQYVITFQHGEPVRFMEGLKGGETIIVQEDDSDFTFDAVLTWGGFIGEAYVLSHRCIEGALLTLSQRMEKRGISNYSDGSLRWAWKWKELEYIPVRQ